MRELAFRVIGPAVPDRPEQQPDEEAVMTYPRLKDEAPELWHALHWRERAVDNWDKDGRRSQWVLGEDEQGDLHVPSLRRRDWWVGYYDARKPWHWPFWLLSRLTKRVAMIETYS